MKVTAAIAAAPGQPLSIEEVDMAENLGPHEVLVRNVASGICHSDMSMRDLPEGFTLVPGFDFLPKPVILGHEGSGIIEKIGSEVTVLAPGDHVIMSFHYDGECANCDKGMHAYCETFLQNNLSGLRVDGSRAVTSPNYDALSASYHQQSSFATHSIATDRNAIRVPRELPLEMLGPLGCGFLTGAGAVLNRLRPRQGSSFAVFGAGPLGFAAIHMAKQAGCDVIIAVDLHESRLTLASEFGATHTVNASLVENSVDAIRAICPRGVDYSYEAAGSAAVMTQAVEAMAPQGHCVISGVVLDPEARVSIVPAALEAGKSVSGITMGDGNVPQTLAKLIEAVRSGDFPIRELITYYDFENINRAIEDSERGRSVKCVVRMPT